LTRQNQTTPQSNQTYRSGTESAAMRPHISLADQAFEEAVAIHQQGRLDEATRRYEKILAESPEHAQALHLLGVIDHQRGEHLAAVGKIERALTLKPDAVLFRKNLASAARSAGQLEKARTCCENVLAVEPREAVMYTLLGRICETEEKWTEAARHYEKSLEIGLVDAETLETLLHLGDCYSRVGRSEDARRCYRDILDRDPWHLFASHNLAREYQFAGQLEEAETYYDQTLDIDSNCASAWNNLGVVHQTRGRFEKSRRCLERARQLMPSLPDVHNNLANVLEALGDVEPCKEMFQQAISLRPHYPEAYHSLSQIYLRERDFTTGWDLYRWRYQKKEHDHRNYGHPTWDGSECQDKTLLVFSEQGIGDVIMFATCLPDLLERVSQVVLEVDARFVPLFTRSFPQVRVIPRPTQDSTEPMHVEGVDCQISIADLPAMYRQQLADFPACPQLLQADEKSQQRWKERFASLGKGLKVGISWFGGKNVEFQTRRSIPLMAWDSILTLPDVHFVNLQYGPKSYDCQVIQEQLGVTIHDWTDSDPLTDLDDFAAKVAGLDLVISIDNATVHLAGALGVETWCLISKGADWRWGLNDEQSIWYDNLKLIRQSTAGDWADVLTRVQTELHDRSQVQAHTAASSPAPDKNSLMQAIQAGVADAPQQHAADVPASFSQSSAPVQVKPRCAIISPVGPGHDDVYLQAERSIRDACIRGAGPFREVIPFRIDDPEGKVGRSRARNFAVQQALAQGIEWVFFLDADDLLVPDAFLNIEACLQNYDAIWGQIYAFVDGTNQAERRAGQLGTTTRFEDILASDPYFSLQMGHFVRTEVAAKYPFNEQMDTGEDFDYYLRVWENERCIKLDTALFANRRGRHSSGPRSATGQDWTVTVNRLLEQRRRTPASKPIVTPGAIGSHNPPSAVAPMKLAIYGMMRSGTTLLCDKLTVPGQGLVLLEPNMHLENRPDHVRRQLESFGINIPEAEWQAGTRHGFQQFFNSRILPELNRLNYWGVKMVNFTRWQDFLQQYPAEHLLLCVRDIRDVVLSALDLAPKLESFVTNEWIQQRALETAAGLVEMSARSHRLLRYEDFCRHPEVIDQVAAQLGLPTPGSERIGLEAVPHRLYEAEKHGDQVSTRSVGRFASEPEGVARQLAERVWKQCGDYCRAFGYPTFEEATSGAAFAPAQPARICDQTTSTVTQPGKHPIAEYWKQDRLANIIPQNASLGSFPEGWDVRPFLSEFVNVGPAQSVLEVGCGYGRLCEAFPAGKYRGVDVNPEAIAAARQLHPAYQFESIDFAAAYPTADRLLVYTVLLHIDDLSVGPMIGQLCAASPVVVVAEILGRERWRRAGNPPVFNRDRQDYVGLFADYGFRLSEQQDKPYEHYPDTNISFLKFVRTT